MGALKEIEERKLNDRNLEEWCLGSLGVLISALECKRQTSSLDEFGHKGELIGL